MSSYILTNDIQSEVCDRLQRGHKCYFTLGHLFRLTLLDKIKNPSLNKH